MRTFLSSVETGLSHLKSHLLKFFSKKQFSNFPSNVIEKLRRVTVVALFYTKSSLSSKMVPPFNQYLEKNDCKWPCLYYRRLIRLGDFGQFNLMRLFSSRIKTCRERRIVRLDELNRLVRLQRRIKRFILSRRIMHLSPVFIRDELNDELKDALN